MIVLLLAIAICWLLGYFTLNLAWPWRVHSRAHYALQLILAFALGIGITSCNLFLWLALFREFRGFIWAEIAGVIVLGALSTTHQRERIKRRPGESFTIDQPRSSLAWLVASAFLMALVAGCSVFLLYSARQPHGSFDAVSMWNAKARLIFRSNGDWTLAASPLISHADYPLLLPLSIARGWRYAGNDSTVFPSALALLFTFGTAGLVASSLALFRGRTQGFLAGLVLLALPIFVGFGAWQYADMPFSFLALSTVVLFCLYDYAAAENRSLLVLAGITAGLAAWTKNEGLLFVLALLAVRAFIPGMVARRRLWRSELLWFSAGLLPLLSIVAYYKFRVVMPNDILAGQSFDSAFAKLADVSRYKLIAKAVAQKLGWFGDWDPNPIYLFALYPLLVGGSRTAWRRPGLLTAVGVLALMSAGYLLVYVLTPRDLSWHLLTSLDRLMVQLWPLFVFSYFMTIATPEEALSAGQA